MLACTALVGCTNEEVIDNPNENPVLNGDKAYIAINVVNSDGSARSRGENVNNVTNPFIYGTTEENEITSVNFYFFKDNALTHKTTGQQISWTRENGTPAENVEMVGQATVVLDNLTSVGTPNRVVAVLNAPAGFDAKVTAGTTLAQLQGLTTETLYNTNGNFIITNSTYRNHDDGETAKTEVDETYGFATVITKENFLDDPDVELTEENSVDIYVERVAAKVEVKAASNAEFKEGKFELGAFTIDGEETTLFAEILNWGLNAQTYSSYMLKNVDNSWDWYTDGTKEEDWKWNDVANHRSYWAKSVNYEKGTYPLNFEAVLDPEYATTGEAEAMYNQYLKGQTLKYITWNAIVNEGASFNEVQYCHENTNTDEILSANYFNAAVTSAVLAANLYTKTGDTYNTIDLIRYDRTLYTVDNFVAHIANLLVQNWGANYVCWTVDATTYKVMFDQDFIEISDLEDGLATIAEKNIVAVINAKIKSAAADSKIYGAAEVTEDTQFSWYDGEGDNAAAVTTTLTEAIDGLAVSAEHWKDGMMYYNIPVEHSRIGDGIFEEGDAVTTIPSVAEAEYGVVRNHYYQINVNKIENIGTAVNNGNEAIITNTKNDKLYYIGASIYVLSWKIVDQDVDL